MIADHCETHRRFEAALRRRLLPRHVIVLTGSLQKNARHHRPIVGAPMAPHITPPVPAESATQTANAITMTAMAVTWSGNEAARMITKKAIFTASATIGECAIGQPGTSESKDNCKNNYGIA
jgi:hypothetical protein